MMPTLLICLSKFGIQITSHILLLVPFAMMPHLLDRPEFHSFFFFFPVDASINLGKTTDKVCDSELDTDKIPG